MFGISPHLIGNRVDNTAGLLPHNSDNSIICNNMYMSDEIYNICIYIILVYIITIRQLCKPWWNVVDVLSWGLMEGRLQPEGLQTVSVVPQRKASDSGSNHQVLYHQRVGSRQSHSSSMDWYATFPQKSSALNNVFSCLFPFPCLRTTSKSYLIKFQ